MNINKTFTQFYQDVVYLICKDLPSRDLLNFRLISKVWRQVIEERLALQLPPINFNIGNILLDLKKPPIWTRRIYFARFNAPSPEQYAALAQKVPLTVIDFKLSPAAGWFGDRDMNALVGNLPKCFTTVTLNNRKRTTDECLKTIAEAWPNLTFLDISGWYKLKGEGLLAIAEGCKNLTTLNLSNSDKLRPENLVAFAKICPLSLVTLDLTKCKKVTDSDKSAIRKLIPKVKVI